MLPPPQSPVLGAEAQGTPEESSPFHPTATVRELMDGVVDPAADFLWASVASISTRAGLEERQPRTTEAWHEVRRHAITLVESTNLIVMKGRRVSATYLPAANSEELDSTEAQRRIEASWDVFVAGAHVLGEVGGKALTAIDAKDASALFEVGSEIDAVCESCHTKFWYPNRISPNP
jgi:hypothetical protein